jgi:HK97 gp10 family phage protein
MATNGVKVEGLADLEREMNQLSKSAGRRVLRASLQKSTPELINKMKANAPVASGALRDSITATTKLAKAQSRQHKKMFKDDKLAVEFFIGPSYNLGAGGRHAHFLEFGTVNISPQPFARPAFDSDKMKLLGRVEDNLKTEFNKSLARMMKRAKKLE